MSIPTILSFPSFYSLFIVLVADRQLRLFRGFAQGPILPYCDAGGFALAPLTLNTEFFQEKRDSFRTLPRSTYAFAPVLGAPSFVFGNSNTNQGEQQGSDWTVLARYACDRDASICIPQDDATQMHTISCGIPTLPPRLRTILMEKGMDVEAYEKGAWKDTFKRFGAGQIAIVYGENLSTSGSRCLLCGPHLEIPLADVSPWAGQQYDDIRAELMQSLLLLLL